VAAAAAVFLVLGPGRPLPEDLFGGVSGAAFLVLSLAYATVGALITSRLAGHRVGWLFLVSGLLIALNGLSYSYATYGLYATDGGAPSLTAAVLGWGQVTAPLMGLSLLLFPEGRLPSRRWRPVAAGLAVAIMGFLVSAALRPGPFDEPFQRVINPLGVAGLRDAMNGLNFACWIVTWVALGLGAVALVLRRRRAHGDERQQLKWVLTVAIAVVAMIVPVMGSWFIWEENVQWRMAVLGVAFTAFPVAAGIAILRHRLYDIDVVINRALVYGALTLLLATTYAAIVLLLGAGQRVGAGDRRRHARGRARLPPAARPPAGCGRPPLQPRALRRGAPGGGLPRGGARGHGGARARRAAAPRRARRRAARVALPAAGGRRLRRRARRADGRRVERRAPADAD